MRREDIKPCPFCGGEAELEDFGGGYYYVRCYNCGIEQTTTINDPDFAVMRWNTRTGLTALDYLNEKAKMCKTAPACAGCEMASWKNGTRQACGVFELEHPEKALEIVKGWRKRRAPTGLFELVDEDEESIALVCTRCGSMIWAEKQDGHAPEPPIKCPHCGERRAKE